MAPCSVSSTEAIDGSTVWNNSGFFRSPQHLSSNLVMLPKAGKTLLGNRALCYWHTTAVIPSKHSSCSSGNSQTGNDNHCKSAHQLAAIPDGMAKQGQKGLRFLSSEHLFSSSCRPRYEDKGHGIWTWGLTVAPLHRHQSSVLHIQGNAWISFASYWEQHRGARCTG